MRVILWSGAMVLGVGVFGSVACGGNSSAGLGNPEAGLDGAAAVGGSSGSAAGGAGGTTGGTGGGVGGAGGATGGAAGTGGSDAGPGCNPTADEDYDADGFSITDGDCDDCNAKVNPGAFEITPGGADDDCDGTIDNAATCDDTLAIDDASPANAARAIELCKTATANDSKWGVLSASWVLADGAAPSASLANFHLGHGNLSGFGTNVTVQAGQRLLALSSGTARDPSDPGYQDVGGFNKGYTSGHPQGFPKESPSCPGITTGSPYDATGLEVKIRVPTNAVGFEYDQKFYTYEWPAYVCSQFNDFFVAMLTPTPVGQTDGNIAFDSLGNPININNDLLEVCGCTSGPPCSAGGKNFTCSLGITDLAGTGFETHAATGWLTTRVPVQGGSEITIRFAAYDSADGILDSTVLLDNWRWLSTGAPAGPVTTAKP